VIGFILLRDIKQAKDMLARTGAAGTLLNIIYSYRIIY
jgi:hypothetical protein